MKSGLAKSVRYDIREEKPQDKTATRQKISFQNVPTVMSPKITKSGVGLHIASIGSS